MPRRDPVEFDDYAAMLRRMIAGAGRRVANADPEDLATLRELRAAMDEAIRAGVIGLRGQGHSWASIARPLGVTRQAVFLQYRENNNEEGSDHADR
jgi:hypothetical protein